MLKSVRAVVDEAGTVRLLEPVAVDRPRMAILTILDDEKELDAARASETAILSEAALEDWNRTEEDEAWAHLKREP